MALSPFQRRLLWRRRPPSTPSEIRRTERWLASARVFLAISALVAIWMDPGEVGHSFWAFWMLAVYIVHGVVIMLLLRVRQQSTPAFRLLVHAADVLWPALISVFATGPGNPFFLFFVFVLTAAAYRWGLWETVGTSGAAVALLWLESLALNHSTVAQSLDRLLIHFGLPSFHVDISEFEPKRLFMRSIYLLVMGFLLGYLAEQQKQLRAEKTVITRILGRARVEAGLTGTLQGILSDIASMYGSTLAIIASQEANSHHVFAAEVRLDDGEHSVFTWFEHAASDRQAYLFESEADVLYLRRSADGLDESMVALDSAGDRIRNSGGVPVETPEVFRAKHGFRELIMVSFLFGREWSGRIFILDPAGLADPEEELRFLQEVIKQVGPAVYNVYLLRRLRLRAGAAERARFARELHDGAVQSLIAVEMQVDVLRRQSSSRPELLTDELQRIQLLLREEVLKLRELMQQMKSVDLDSRRMVPFLSDTVERFQRETGIAAQFASETEYLDIPQPICREIARIVQEALVNVRKHSQATQVRVRMGVKNGAWILEIADNGRGFPFTGRLSLAEMDSLSKGPLVIKERVRLIEAELTIESNPGQGARLEITAPLKREALYG